MTSLRSFVCGAALSLFCAIGLGAESIQFTDMTGGLNTEKPGILLADNESPALQNIIIDESGGATRRKGYTRRNATAIGDGDDDVNSVFWLAQSDGDEFCVSFSSTTGYFSTDACATFTAFISTLTRNNDVNCIPYADNLYCVNNQYEFRFDGTNDIPFSGPGNSDIIQVHNNRCFVAGTDANPSRLFWSNLGTCNTWTTASDYVDIDAEDGDVIIGLGEPLFGMLVIYKRYSTWVLKGDGPSNWFLVNASKNTGARSHRSIRNFGNVQVFDSLGPHGGQAGIYAFDGATIREVSRKIRSDIETLGFFGATTGRKTVDSKADWDGGAFLADAMSSSRETGFMQSSFTTLTDTAGIDFSLGALTNLSTISINGAITIVQPDSMTFINAGAETNGTLNWSQNAYTRATSSNFFGSANWRAENLGNGICNEDVEFDILDVSTATVLINRYTLTNGLPVTDRTIDLSTITQQRIILYATTTNGGTKREAYSVPFIRPNNIKIRIQDWDTSDDCSLAWDVWEPSAFITSAAITSRAFDTYISTPIFGLFSVTSSSTSNSTLAFRTQVATSAFGVWETAVTASTGVEVASIARRYIRYDSSFTVTAATHVPAQINAITITAASTGIWTSNELFLSNAITTWGLYSSQQTTSGSEASLSYCIRRSTYSGGAKYDPCTSQTNNSAISASTGAYVIIVATFTVGVATETAKIDSIVLNWNEGTIARQATAAIFRNRYHYGGQSQGSTVNDVIYVMDLKGAWSKWTGVSPRHLNVIDQKFVMADSSTTSTGYIYQLYDSDADDGNAIEAFWESKDIGFGDTIKRKAVERLYLLTSNDDALLTVTLKADTGIRSKAFSVNLSTGAAFKLHQVPVEGLGEADTFRLRVGNNAASKPWEVFGYGFSVRDLGIRQP